MQLPVQKICAAAALLAGTLPGLAHGQAYDRVAPKTLPENAPVAAPAPAAPAPVAASAKVVLPALKGLVFLSDPSTLQKGGALGISGISAPGLPLPAEPGFMAQMMPFLGQKLTLADLNTIAQHVTGWYREHDQPFMSVTVPPQNISSGVVQIVVSQYRVGAVKTEGNRWFSDDLLIGESGLVSGQYLRFGELQDDLDWLNGNPFRTVTTVFRPGSEAGQTDVVLKTEDRLPLRLYASFDNAGQATLGRGEWGVGVNWGNALGLDQQLAYQFTRSISNRFDAHSLSWTTPLPWRDKVIVFGSYEEERPDIGRDFGETGTSGQASLRYVHSLPRLTLAEGVGLTQDVQIGYDFKTTNNDLEFGGIQVFASAVEVDQFPLVYEGTETDIYGRTAIDNQLVYSPGGLTAGNGNAAFRAEVPSSRAGYVYDRIELSRVTFLPAGFSWVARVVGQVADGNLQFSEQLGAGGVNSVRGCYTDTAIGSQGVLVSQEVRAPAVSLLRLLGQSLPVEDRAQFGAFWDYGHVSQVDTIPDRVNSASLSSLGVDAHLTLDRYFDVRVDIGWQLRAAPGSSDRGSFTDVSVTAGF